MTPTDATPGPTDATPGPVERLREAFDAWRDRVAGKSWMMCDGNPAALKFAVRSAAAGLPTDDEVLYGKIGGLGELIHISEIEQPAREEP